MEAQENQQAQPKVLNLQLFAPHDTQREILTNKARYRVCTLGRRAGKTLMGSNAILDCAATLPEAECFWVAKIFSQTEIAYGMVQRALAPTGLIAKHERSMDRITLINGSRITFRSIGQDPDRLRGPGLDFLVLDEFGEIRDRKIWNEILNPMLADRNGKALIIGTPKGRGQFYDFWQNGQKGLRGDADYSDWASWKLPSECNPFLSRDFIEKARKSLPAASFQQEWLAEFLDESAGVFKGIKACISRQWDGAAPFFSDMRNVAYNPMHSYSLGWDPARYTNWSVLTVMDKTTREVVAWERFNQIDWSFQLAKMRNLAQIYHANLIMDATGAGDVLVDRARVALQPFGLGVTPYVFTNQSKNELIEGLMIGIEQTHVHYPNIPEVIDELESFQYDISDKSGKVIYSAPDGADDDTVMSLALAYWGANRSAFFEDLAPADEPTIQLANSGIAVDALALLYGAPGTQAKPDPQAGWVFDPLTGTIRYPDGRGGGGRLF